MTYFFHPKNWAIFWITILWIVITKFIPNMPIQWISQIRWKNESRIIILRLSASICVLSEHYFEGWNSWRAYLDELNSWFLFSKGLGQPWGLIFLDVIFKPKAWELGSKKVPPILWIRKGRWIPSFLIQRIFVASAYFLNNY